MYEWQDASLGQKSVAKWCVIRFLRYLCAAVVACCFCRFFELRCLLLFWKSKRFWQQKNKLCSARLNVPNVHDQESNSITRRISLQQWRNGWIYRTSPENFHGSPLVHSKFYVCQLLWKKYAVSTLTTEFLLRWCCIFKKSSFNKRNTGCIFLEFFFHFFSGGNIYSSHKVAFFQENGLERFCCTAKLHFFSLVLVGICIRSFWPMGASNGRILVKMTNGASNERIEFSIVKLTEGCEQRWDHFGELAKRISLRFVAVRNFVIAFQ